MVNPSNEFEVFGYDYYPILGYATDQPNEIFYNQADTRDDSAENEI
jgi:hypothetical protein